MLLINEFDYVSGNPLQPVQLLQQNYLGVSQNGAAPVNYMYAYIAPSNTGIASGFDLNNNGAIALQPDISNYAKNRQRAWLNGLGEPHLSYPKISKSIQHPEIDRFIR